MKRPIPIALLMLFALLSATAYSQNTTTAKPRLFANFPDRINCSITELSKVFTTAATRSIDLSFSDNFLFSGTVTSNVVKYANLQTVVIKSPRFGDAIFVLSKITVTDGSSNYVGHIINTKYFDGYDLKRDASGNYQLIKIETSKVIQDCSQN